MAFKNSLRAYGTSTKLIKNKIVVNDFKTNRSCCFKSVLKLFKIYFVILVTLFMFVDDVKEIYNNVQKINFDHNLKVCILLYITYTCNIVRNALFE